MKIRTQAEIDHLDARIKSQLGIDVQKYRNPEVVNKIIALIGFPEYLITWTLKPILYALALYLIGFGVLDLDGTQYLLYGIVGFSLFLSTGAFFGLLLLMRKMKKDMLSVMEFSLGIMGEAVNDLAQVQQEINEENKREILVLLFNGIIHIVVIPVATKSIADQIKFIGRWLASIVKWILTWMADQFKFNENLIEQEMRRKDHEASSFDFYHAVLEASTIAIKRVSNFTFTILQTPFAIGFFSSLIMLLLFLFFIHQTF